MYLNNNIMTYILLLLYSAVVTILTTTIGAPPRPQRDTARALFDYTYYTAGLICVYDYFYFHGFPAIYLRTPTQRCPTKKKKKYKRTYNALNGLVSRRFREFSCTGRRAVLQRDCNMYIYLIISIINYRVHLTYIRHV